MKNIKYQKKHNKRSDVMKLVKIRIRKFNFQIFSNMNAALYAYKTLKTDVPTVLCLRNCQNRLHIVLYQLHLWVTEDHCIITRNDLFVIVLEAVCFIYTKLLSHKFAFDKKTF